MAMGHALTRIAHDELLGDIDVDRMEHVMNSEIEALRTATGLLTASRQNLIDHFTRNSPQSILTAMRDRLSGDRLRNVAEAVRAVMYQPGQTVVPKGYVIEVSERGAVRLVQGANEATPS